MKGGKLIAMNDVASSDHRSCKHPTERDILFAAASYEHVLLEKDFKLIEPWTCVVEQLSAGVEMITAGRPKW